VRSATWRALHPATRGHFLEAERPRALQRLYYTAPDGWQAPVFYLPPAPGGAGEPVILAHTLGVGCDGFRYGAGATLAGVLARQGFAVYLFSHRGDRCAIAPTAHAHREVSFDEILSRDLPAAASLICAHAGYPRAQVVGHGLGGVLAMAWAARQPAELASVVALGAPLRFERVRTELRRTARALTLLPSHWELPARTLAKLAAPLLDDQGQGGPRTRGVMEYAMEDVPIGLVRQLMSWQDHGRPVDRSGTFDYTDALVEAQVPLLVMVGADDTVARPEDAQPSWGHEDHRLEVVAGMGHLDLLLDAGARQRVFEPVGAWLHQRRRLAWERDGELRAC